MLKAYWYVSFTNGKKDGYEQQFWAKNDDEAIDYCIDIWEDIKKSDTTQDIIEFETRNEYDEILYAGYNE